MKVLLPGISGLLARIVARKLHARGHEVVGIDSRPWPDVPDGIAIHTVDIRKRAAEDVFRTTRPDAVIHMATVTHLLKKSSEEQYRINLGGTRAVWDHCHAYGVKQAIFVGRHTYYGAAPDSPLNASPGVSDAIEDVSFQGMAVRQTRVIEIIRGIVRHAQFFHHPPGGQIVRNRHGNEFPQPQRSEGVGNDGAGSFGCQALVPESLREAPADLHRRHEGSLEGGNPEPDIAGEPAACKGLHRVKTKPATFQIGHDAVHHVVALGPRESRREVTHDAGIAIHLKKRFAIALAPAAKDQPIGLKIWRFHSFTFLTGPFGT